MGGLRVHVVTARLTTCERLTITRKPAIVNIAPQALFLLSFSAHKYCIVVMQWSRRVDIRKTKRETILSKNCALTYRERSRARFPTPRLQRPK
jgi:hypothetical protein